MLGDVTYSDFREHLKDYLDQVCGNSEPLRVTRRGGKRVVVLSEEDFQSLDATAYLLSSPANAKRLKSALKSKKGTKYKNAKELLNAYHLTS